MLLQTGYPTELHGKVNATKIWDQIYLSKTEAFTRKERKPTKIKQNKREKHSEGLKIHTDQYEDAQITSIEIKLNVVLMVDTVT